MSCPYLEAVEQYVGLPIVETLTQLFAVPQPPSQPEDDPVGTVRKHNVDDPATFYIKYGPDKWLGVYLGTASPPTVWVNDRLFHGVDGLNRPVVYNPE